MDPRRRARQLTVQNATITTATVEIKTLTIGGKSFTQAVYRQLPEEPLITPELTLRGVPWGRVNYCAGKAACGRYEIAARFDNAHDRQRTLEYGFRLGDDDLHIHVIWQWGAALCRSHVWSPISMFHMPIPPFNMWEREVEERYYDLYYQLRALPQLFIAV